MARLDVVKAKETELNGQSEQVIAAEVEKLESPIAWRVLHHFDPVSYPEKMPDGFKAATLKRANMSI